MDGFAKYKNFVIIGVFMAVYYVVLYILRWPFSYLVAIYAAGLAVTAVVFRAGLFSGLANIYYSSGNRAKARTMFERAIRHKSKNPVTYLNYAIMLLHDGESEKALELSKKTLNMNPNIMTQKNAHLTIGSCYWVMGKLETAIETLEHMMASYDYVNAHVLSTLGFLYFITGDTVKAREVTEKAIDEDQSSGAAWDNMGQIYLKENDLDKAEEAFGKAIAIKNDLVDSLYYLGVICERKGDNAKAAEYFGRARFCRISHLNTVTKEQIAEKYEQYVKSGKDQLEHEEDVENTATHNE